MNWLKENVYVAAWLALPVMVIVALIQGRWVEAVGGVERRGDVWPLKKVLVYLLFLICFPLTISPWMEGAARWVCGMMAGVCFLGIIFTSDKEWLDLDEKK